MSPSVGGRGDSYRNEFAFGRRERRSLGETQARLQRVEIRFQLGFLRELRWLLRAAIVAEFSQLRLGSVERVVRCAILQPGSFLFDPFQQVRRQSFVFHHHLFILLIDRQHFTNATGRLFSLDRQSPGPFSTKPSRSRASPVGRSYLLRRGKCMIIR